MSSVYIGDPYAAIDAAYQRHVDDEDAYASELEKRTDEQIAIIEDGEIIDLFCDGDCGLAEAAQMALYDLMKADKGTSSEGFNEAAKGLADAVNAMIYGMAKERAEASIKADLSTSRAFIRERH